MHYCPILQTGNLNPREICDSSTTRHWQEESGFQGFQPPPAYLPLLLQVFLDVFAEKHILKPCQTHGVPVSGLQAQDLHAVKTSSAPQDKYARERLCLLAGALPELHPADRPWNCPRWVWALQAWPRGCAASWPGCLWSTSLPFLPLAAGETFLAKD